MQLFTPEHDTALKLSFVWAVVATDASANTPDTCATAPANGAVGIHMTPAAMTAMAADRVTRAIDNLILFASSRCEI
jgi:hypothetical protein